MYFDQLSNLIQFVNSTIGSSYFLLLIEFVSCSFKLYFLVTLLLLSFRSPQYKKYIYLLIGVLMGAIVDDFAWIMHLVKNLFIPELDIRVLAFISRAGWSLIVVQSQSIIVLLNYLIDKKFRYTLMDYGFLIINSLLFFGLIFIAFDKFNEPSLTGVYKLVETKLIQCSRLIIFPMILPIIYRAVNAFKKNSIPKILKQQFIVFITYVVIPYYAISILSSKLLMFRYISHITQIKQHAFTVASTILMTYLVYYGSRRLTRLRFLDVYNHVTNAAGFDFINDFKDILELLSQVTSMQELAHLTQTFFKSAFGINQGRSRLYIRTKEPVQSDEKPTLYQDIANVTMHVENFIMHPKSSDCNIQSFLHQTKILIKDEIEFTHFYDNNIQYKVILDFLDSINADLFIPIYERNSLSAYIIVERNARKEELYSNSDRDEMVVFASYMANIISILKHHNLDALIKREKELQEELYLKHQESKQYRESLRSFIRSSKDRKIGIIFYKGRRFTLANQAAQDIINFDINLQEGHPLSQSLRQITRKVLEFKASQSTFAKDTQGNKLIFSAIPSFDANMVIVLVYYPEISDIIKTQFDMLKDPSQWDYLLYLETTHSGQLINQLIPGTGETLLTFKINLLATALGKKATLLDLPDEDLLPTVEILHHISLRQTLHVLKLHTPEKHSEVGLKLFGINPLFDKNAEESLLEKLNNIGTLFIENIHLLSMASQEELARLISYGFFYKVKSDHKQFSNVRIICSSNKNLQQLVTEGIFSKNLYNELNKTTIVMPSLSTLPKEEISDLVEGLAEQALKVPTFKNLLELSEKDRQKIVVEPPTSLVDFKNKINQVLSQKSAKNNIYEKTEFDPAYYVDDPELIEAIRLGKKALKDPEILKMLWSKFKNQNKIATLLGVNRSSVNRRCKEYNLTE